jgi:hypothetical protein
VVTGVSVSEGKAVLDVGTEQVALDAVIKVKASAGT